MSEKREFPILHGKLLSDLDANGKKIIGLDVEVDENKIQETVLKVVGDKLDKKADEDALSAEIERSTKADAELARGVADNESQILELESQISESIDTINLSVSGESYFYDIVNFSESIEFLSGTSEKTVISSSEITISDKYSNGERCLTITADEVRADFEQGNRSNSISLEPEGLYIDSNYGYAFVTPNGIELYEKRLDDARSVDFWTLDEFNSLTKTAIREYGIKEFSSPDAEDSGLSPYSQMYNYISAKNILTELNIKNPQHLYNPNSSGLRDCAVVIDCVGIDTAPSIWWPNNFHPRTDKDTDFACVAGVRNVYWITEYAVGEFCVAGWQETEGGNAE
jgi:hypothetical protein